MFKITGISVDTWESTLNLYSFSGRPHILIRTQFFRCSSIKHCASPSLATFGWRYFL